jgi:hypothetical protein
MERFLYRLAKSPFSDRFVLKGALLLTAWRAPLSRPTMDIDLAGRTSNELDHITELVGTVCEVVTEPEGVEFNRASIEARRIKEHADYEGVRVRFHATLARARIPMQIDIGFGDVIVPGPTEVEYPTLLDFPAPVLRAYPRETRPPAPEPISISRRRLKPLGVATGCKLILIRSKPRQAETNTAPDG